MAALAFSAADAVDREVLTPEEFSALNSHWEDESARVSAFRALVLVPLTAAVDLPSVLYPLIVSWLSPPSLPAALAARRAAKDQMAAELQSLMEQQAALRGELTRVADEAESHLAFRQQARQTLQQRARQAEQQQQAKEEQSRETKGP